MLSEDNPEGFVDLKGVSKRFGGTLALDNVSLSLRPGEIHALVGENGAGKSTVGKVIAGIYQQDGGELLVDGKPVSKWNPSRAQKEAIVMIAQELALVPDLTVEENVFLGVEEHRVGIARRNLTQRFGELESMVGFGLDPKAKVRNLR
ncbi:ATP-binding cassette domain-containing protein, partial [Arthrobacter sp. UNC362MFTsu5.1]|uniref:ATP-binding cassette domain-containing protein n=1 Tax=Arthrobacter sp. UNC362MFTsu5.1 TaxID=1449044 RepID=UPI0005BA3A5B